jgi:hypothetical protein
MSTSTTSLASGSEGSFLFQCQGCHTRGQGTIHQNAYGASHTYKVVNCSCLNCREAARLESSRPHVPPNAVPTVPSFPPCVISGSSFWHPPVLPTHPLKPSMSTSVAPMTPPVTTPFIPTTPWEPSVPGCFPGVPFPECSSAPYEASLPPPSSPTPAPSPISNTAPPPLVHIGVICDMCEKTIVGVRHKCLDCPGRSRPV